MELMTLGGGIRLGLVACAFPIFLSGCSTPSKLTPEQLASLGVSEGAAYWVAEQKLAQEGYHAYVSGAKRDEFDFTKETGAFPTCVLRVRFKVSDQNLVTNLQIAEPACIGTP